MKGQIKRTDEQRKRISEIHKGKVVSQETRNKIREGLAKTRTINGCKIDEKFKGGNHHNSKKAMIVFSTGEVQEYDNFIIMAEKLNKEYGYSKRGIESNWRKNGIPKKYWGEIKFIGTVEEYCIGAANE